MWFPPKPGDTPEGLSWSLAGSCVTALPTECESLVKGPGYRYSFQNKQALSFCKERGQENISQSGK